MQGQPKVSVILPSLNVAAYIRECVESVMNQTLKDIEIICVDSGSTDGTLEILREYEAKDKRIKVLVADRKSYGLQMNIGMDAATGEYLGIVETDDWVPPKMFQDLYRVAKKNALDFVKADFYRFTVNPDGSLVKTYNKLSRDDSYYNKVLIPGDDPETFKFIMNTWSGIYDLAFLRRWNIRHNETPGASYQDNGFWFQTFCRAQKALFLNKPYYMNRRDNPNSSVYSKTKVYCMRDEYDYLRAIVDADEELWRFIPLCEYFRFCGYYYNTMRRISPELRREFIAEFSKEFRALAEAHELDRSLFSQREWDDLQQIMFLPDQYLSVSLKEALQFKLQESYLSYQNIEASGPAVSVIVPVYNVRDFVRECLDSIRAQSFTDFEVVCVDDGSTDDSLEILEEYAAKDSRVKVLHQENAGLSSARNLGLSYATGSYICFVDSDDGIAPNALERLVSVARKNDADVVVCGLDIDHYPLEGERPSWIESKNPKRSVTFGIFEPKVLFDEAGAKPFVQRDFVRRAFLAQNNLWFCEDCRMGEDTIFQFEMFPKARNITFIRDKLAYYRCSRAGSLMASGYENVAVKASHHLKIIGHLMVAWKAEGYLQKWRDPFACWATDFFYGQFALCAAEDKPALARGFISMLRCFLSEDQQKKLGPGRQERIGEIQTYCDSSLYPVCPAGDNPPLAKQHSEVEKPQVSIVVPVHNGEGRIARTLDSLLGQTLDAIEVICVDDASSDGTGKILESYAARDQRLRVITYTENLTANQARKDAVLAARGSYILFCDGDDTLEPMACERLCGLMANDPVDILHFGVNVVSEGAFEEDRLWVEGHTIPYYGILRGPDVFDACFRADLYGFNLWNKMYEAGLAKKAFAHVEDGRFPRGQDVYAFCLLAYFAESYRGLFGEKLYNYHLGAGLDGTQTLSLDKFRSFCALACVADAVGRFFEGEGVFNLYEDVWFSMRSRLLGDCVNKWFKKVADADKGKAFDEMLAYWPTWLVADAVARRYWNHPDQAFVSLNLSSCRSIKKPEIHTVAMYYHKVTGGGVEKVIQLLTPLWISMGYRVVIITDVQGPEDAFSFPEGVVLRAVPNGGVGKPYGYIQRARAFSRIMHEEQVDALVYHAWNTALLPWDMLTVKAAGSAFLVYCHSVFSMRVLLGQAYFSMMPPTFGFADGVVCLSDADKAFWCRFNANTHVVLNPIEWLSFGTGENLQMRDPNQVLWVGRLESEKHPEEALRIFSSVLRVLPDARLGLLGKAPSEDAQANLEKFARELGIEGSVEFLGFHDDPAPFYKKASVFLCTSEYEGLPLSILEALAAGLPVVMYDLSYLTIVQNNESIVPVPFGDADMAADELVGLLADTERRERLSRCARSYAQNLASYDYAEVWEGVFSSLGELHQPPVVDASERLMWDTLLRHYAMGITKLVQQRDAARRGGCGGGSEIERIHKSASYRIGRTITWPARKIRTLIECVNEHGLSYTVRVYLKRG